MIPKSSWSDGLRYVRSAWRAIPLSYPKRIECNVCGWQGRRFRSDAWHKHTICPVCTAAIRHRLLFAALQHCDSLRLEDIVAGKRVLHFAPERFLSKKLRHVAHQLITADLANPRRDVQLDITDMWPVEEHQFDLLIACDVLEHVEDDHRALREMCRILRPGGYAILTVPQQDYLDVTLEDPLVTDPADRQRLFGQHDHLRIYGTDFQDRIESAGFRVRRVERQDFPESLVTRHVLSPPERSPHPLATNDRKIYFAEKVGPTKSTEEGLHVVRQAGTGECPQQLAAMP